MLLVNSEKMLTTGPLLTSFLQLEKIVIINTLLLTIYMESSHEQI
jgi:hypothetical protein